MDLELIKNKLRNPQQYGQATPEEAKFAYDSGYMGGDKTQAYYKELGILDPPQDTVTPEETTPVRALSPAEQYARAQEDAKANGSPVYDPETVAQNEARREAELAAQQTEQTKQNPDLGKFKDTDAVDRAMGAWSPIAPVAFAGGDRSGEAAGYRAGAVIQDKAASDYSKILQWNKQRATDNTLADKVAAAQASGKWKQNANALGAEGGASVVASQNEAVTPDIMAQKQYQSQQMNTATQNLAEVNARKVAAQNNRTKADMADYNTQYNDSKDAYATNLATAKPAQNKSTEEKKEEPKAETTTTETTEKPDGKVENNTQNEKTQAAAETNQQSQAMENATQEVSEQQELQNLADEIEGIHKAVETMKGNSQTNAESLRKQKARYDEIKPRYDELAAKSKNPPPTPATPDFGMFDPKLSEVPSSTKVSSSILNGVNQRF